MTSDVSLKFSTGAPWPTETFSDSLEATEEGFLKRTPVLLYGMILVLVVAGVGYWQGWFGTIFGDVLISGRASVDSQADFDEGEYAQTEFRDGALRLSPLPALGTQESE